MTTICNILASICVCSRGSLMVRPAIIRVSTPSRLTDASKRQSEGTAFAFAIDGRTSLEDGAAVMDAVSWGATDGVMASVIGCFLAGGVVLDSEELFLRALARVSWPCPVVFDAVLC